MLFRFYRSKLCRGLTGQHSSKQILAVLRCTTVTVLARLLLLLVLVQRLAGRRQNIAGRLLLLRCAAAGLELLHGHLSARTVPFRVSFSLALLSPFTCGRQRPPVPIVPPIVSRVNKTVVGITRRDLMRARGTVPTAKTDSPLLPSLALSLSLSTKFHCCPFVGYIHPARVCFDGPAGAADSYAVEKNRAANSSRGTLSYRASTNDNSG